jgi:hypothetical protein
MSTRARKNLAAMAVCGLTLGACASLRSKPPAPVAASTATAAPAPAAPSPAQVVVRVPVPVKEACVAKNFPHSPKYPDTDAALRDAGGAADRYQLMAAGRLLRIQRLADLEKIIEGCR